jgi:sugar lactone lactonase YvrE
MDYSVSPEYSPDGKYLTYISPYGGGLVQHKVNIPHTFANINTGANDRFKSPNIIEYRSGGLGYNFNFNNDGTRIYYGASNYIYQRDLTIPYDISSISSTVKSAYLLYHLPNFTSKSVTNVLFTNNGYTLWYSFNQYIVKVPLSVPYDITNGSEDNYIDLPAGGKFLDFSASGFDNYNYGSAIYDFKFNNDGTILYVSNGSRIWQINLTTPYDWTYPYTPTAHDRDVNIATYSNRGSYSQSASTTLIFDFTDGDHNLSVGDYFTVQFTSGTYATSPIFATYQVDIVSTATQVRTIAGNTTVSGNFISYNNDVKSFSNQNTIYSFDFSPDGTELFVSDDYDNVGVYRLTTAFDISTAVKMNSYDSNSSYTQAGSSFTNPLYFNVHSSTAYPIYGLRVLNNNDVIMYNAGGNLYKLKYDKNHLKYYNHRNNILEFKQPFTDIDNIKYYSNGTVLTYYNNLTNKITVARLNTPNIISSENVQSIKSTEVPLGSILTSTFVTGTNERYAKPDFAFTNDGLKLFFKYNNKLYYFTLSSAFDLTTLSEFKWLYNFGNQDAYSYSFDVSADGTKLIMLGGTSDRVYEYDVDGTTVTYTNKYYSVNSQITTDINKVKFDNNGLKFHVTGKREKKIFEYDTASAFTIAPEYNLKMVDSSPQAMEFNSTGSSFYVLGDSTNAIYQFDMNTNYDVSKSTYASKSLSVTNEETSPKGFTFNSTGSKLYVVGETNSTVFEYSLATPFDVSTGTYSTNSFSVYSQEQAPSGMKFNNDGSKMYIIGNLNQQITEYSLATPYDLSTATYNNVSLSLSNNEILPNDFAFNNDGTKIFIIGSDSDYVYQYLLSSAYDLSTATYSDKSYDVSSNVQVGTGISFSADGKNMYIVDSNESSIYRYDTGSGSVGVVIYTCPANTAAKLLINASGEYGVMKIGDTPIFEYTNSGIYHTTSGHKPRSNTAVKFYASDIEYTIGADDVHQEYYMVGPNEQLKLTESKNSGYSVYVIEDSTGS